MDFSLEGPDFAISWPNYSTEMLTTISLTSIVGSRKDELEGQ